MMDVAQAAGVSIASVSRALHGSTGVSEATRERIQTIADGLAYGSVPDLSVSTPGRTGRVAIVVPHLGTWFCGTMLAAMAPVLDAAELEMLVHQVSDEEHPGDLLRELQARRNVDAAIITALPMARAEAAQLDHMGVHIVSAGGSLYGFPHVEVDDHEVGRLAVQHLVDLGHQRIAMMRAGNTHGIKWSADVLRVRGWRDALAAAGLPASRELLVKADSAERASEAMEGLLRLQRPPTALFAYSDELAIAAMAQARSSGVRVPEGLSVVGVGGHPLGERLGLTTVDHDVSAQGALSAELSVRLVRGEEVPDFTVPVRLVERGSTAAPHR